MKRHLQLLVLLFVIAFLFLPRAFAVINGTRQLDSLFPEVVRLQSRKTLCTATIIGPRVILSAAHCASPRGASFVYGGERYRVKYVMSRLYSSKGHDISVGLVDRVIKNAVYAHVPALRNSPLAIGGAIHLAGFGCTKKSGVGAGKLRVGSTHVFGLDDENFVSIGGGAVCFGDSGGPTFVRKNGQRHLVGVNSRGNIRNISIGVRVDSDSSHQFFQKVAKRFKVAICGVNEDCADVVPVAGPKG